MHGGYDWLSEIIGREADGGLFNPLVACVNRSSILRISTSVIIVRQIRTKNQIIQNSFTVAVDGCSVP